MAAPEDVIIDAALTSVVSEVERIFIKVSVLLQTVSKDAVSDASAWQNYLVGPVKHSVRDSGKNVCSHTENTLVDFSFK